MNSNWMNRPSNITRKTRSTRLTLEQLEGRRLMAADLWDRLDGFSNTDTAGRDKLGPNPSSLESSATLISFRNGSRETTTLGISENKLVVGIPEAALGSPSPLNNSGLQFERSVRPGLGVYSIDTGENLSSSNAIGKLNLAIDSAPLFIDVSTGTELVVWNEVVVALKPGITAETFFNERTEFESYRHLTGTPDQFVATLHEGVGRDAIRSSNAISGDARVAWAQPNFYQSLKKNVFIPNDPRFVDQWHLNNTGQGGGLVDADSDLPEAWDINPGLTSSIVIGIVDDGVPTNHPDLLNWVNTGEIAGDNIDNDGNGWIDDINGWNFVSNNNQSGPTASTDRHGTSVAGVAAARGNNGQGVAGPAFQSRVMGVRIFEGNSVASDADIASAIYYTAGRTANGLGTWQASDIVNHSWGGGPASTAIEAALVWATTAGRQGRGATQFFASGNDFAASPSYPALYSTTIPGVIAVGATNNFGQRSNYSNYGVGLDIVAPSNDTRAGYLSIDTTDRIGTLGYASGDYTGTGSTGFGGTSSATPLSTGIGALTLAQAESQGIYLTPAQLRSYLRNTTDLAGGVTYDASTGTNFEFGYGRINAFTALSGIGKAEVSVVANSQDLVDGTSIVNLGSSFIGQTKDIVVRIRNQGTQALNLNSLSLPSSTFSIVSGLSSTVLGLGASATLTIRFTPTVAGTFTSTVSLLSNDLDETLFDFQITGSSSVAAFSGYAYEDWSGNGQRDSNDPGLTEQILYVDSNNNSFLDTQNQSVTMSTSTPLPDLSQVVSNLAVVAPVGASISDLNVRINLNHTYVGDLKISLKHPDGTTIVLSNQRGGSGANFTNTVFDDEAGSSIVDVTSANAPFTGSFRPDELLSTFDGKAVSGTWQLVFDDLGPGDSGVLNNWELSFIENTEPIAISDAAGYFAFPTLPIGVAQTIRYSETNVDLLPTGPASGNYTFTLPNAGVGSTGDFGFGMVDRSYFRVFHDGNNDGLIASLENGVADRTLFVDVNGDGNLTPTLFSTTGLANTAIPDGQGISSLLTVSNLPTLHQILDLNVTVNINHPFVSDLDLYLMDPDGEFIALVIGAGGSGDNFTNTVFDDEAVNDIQSGTAPFTGSFRPLQPLDFFDGINGNGTWRLFVFDNATTNIGTLVSWQLSFTVGDPVFESNSLGNAFVDLPENIHTIRLINESGWVHTVPNDGLRTTNVAGAPVYQQNFGTRAVASEVQTRAVFYAGSSFETNGGLSGAIDPTRSALLPGQTTSNVNYTNYVRGINGLVVDISNAGTPTATDFAFATWNGASVAGFTPLAASPTVTAIAGAGVNGSTRVRLQFPDQSITNTWLRVTVLANANTGLTANDVFYFGNAIGDFSVGNIGSPHFVRTNATDTGTVRQLSNQSPNPNSVPVTNLFDINKDGRVNATDIGLVRQNQNSNIITYFTAPLSLAFFAENDFTGAPTIDFASASIRKIDSINQASQAFRFPARSNDSNRIAEPTKLDVRKEWIISEKPAKSSSLPNDPRSVDTVFASSLDKIVA